MTKYRLKFFVVLVVVLLATALVMPIRAQSGPAISVNDQVSTGTIVVASVTSDGPGWVVIRNDGGGRGSPGAPLGSAPVQAGVTDNVEVTINTALATGHLFASLHVDDNTEGTFEFGDVGGADAPVEVDGQAVQQEFVVAVIQMDEQFATEDNKVQAATIIIDGTGWLVIHSDNEGKPGPVLGQTLLKSGRNRRVSVELATEGRTGTVWPMLHVDTGVAGEYEFGAVEGADGPVVLNENVATLPVSIEPNVKMGDQEPVAGEDGKLTVTADSVLSQGAGFLVIHTDNGGSPGPVAGFAAVEDGLNQGVVVVLDQADPTAVLWPMLHVDTGTAGEYEFGAVEGADGPAVDAAGNVVTFPINAGGATASAGGNTGVGADCAVSTLTDLVNVNKRSGPGTDNEVLSTLKPGESASVTGSSVSDSGALWWSLDDGSWVRADVVAESGDCGDGAGPQEPASTPEPGA